MGSVFRNEQVDRVRRLAGALVTDPLEGVRLVPEGIASYFEHPVEYDVDSAWEPRLHQWLGAPWPCPERDRSRELWETVIAELEERGLAFGRHTYGQYSDADAALARAVWCTVLHLRPAVVVETGVARGVTSRFVLEALTRNGEGHLWSVDLPHPFERALRNQTGVAVPETHRSRWSYIEGSSRRRLPRLLRQLDQVDVFVHDSLHTARNTRFEMERIGRVLGPRGVMLVDDISTHQGFADWTRKTPRARTLICPTDDGEGLFGIACKNPS
ncbi:class I SAM-dependent methyltransferase [Streptomyces cavernae]|uniref:class I SAM-dependent methyltransferase n=1 Tax=Streptomyces cavernae TaxID=2259034 RepID=UPI0013916F8B|nr:class I SAM-dependent methyltransferase [Streptomyces cavernae]